MHESQQIDCPHCGWRGKLRVPPADGARVRCTRCQEPFIFRSRTSAPPSDITGVSPAVSEPPNLVSAKKNGDMELRLRRLERNNRFLSAACAVLGVVSVAGLILPRYRPPDEPTKSIVAGAVTTPEIFARRINILNEPGEKMIVIGRDPINNQKGRIDIFSSTNDWSHCKLTSEQIEFSDSKTPRRVAIEGGGGVLNAGIELKDELGRSRVLLTADNRGPELGLFDTRSKSTRMRIGIEKRRNDEGLVEEVPYIDYAAPDGTDSSILP